MDRTDWLADTGRKTKTIKTPCGWCKMSLESHWCCVRLKILKQAWIFSASHTITPRVLHPSQGVYSVFVLHPLHDPQDRIRLIRGRTETSIGQGDFCFYSAQIGFPWRTKKRGEQLANRKNRENLCSIWFMHYICTPKERRLLDTDGS